MKVMKKIIFILVFLVFLTSCKEYNTILIDNGVEEIKIKAEVANTKEKKGRGLMFRESLDEDSGMFFIFDSRSYYTFWMKNTLIPLDIIFISSSLDIVDIVYAEPCEEEPCESYKSKRPAKYVLEVNGNFTVRNNIEVGNRIIIK